MTKKKEKKKESTKMANLCKTSYHHYRRLKEILAKEKITGFKFVKNEKDWQGNISIPSTEMDKAKKILADFKIKNPDSIDMWW